MASKYYIETFGCQMNDLDSEKIAGSLLHNGMEPAESILQADVVILNTCSIREKAVQKVYARLGEIGKQKALRRQNLVIGVVGCMAQLEKERILQKAPFVNIVAGPQKGHVISNIVEQSLRSQAPVIDLRKDEDPEPLEAAHIFRKSPWRADVTISEGCNRQCAFCVVPYTRGKERNRESASIICEVRELASMGYIEITFLGQTVSSYRDPTIKDQDFPNLLRSVSEISELKRIRFLSPHPSDFSDELLETIVANEKICNHIHLPVQSGSTKVLKAMGRQYTRDNYLELIRKIKNAPRAIAISTDIIIGFPGETEADFQDTLSLLDEVQYDNIFSFKYSPRPNTAAVSLPDDVFEGEKGRRLMLLQERQKRIQYNKNASYVGQVMEVLVDNKARRRVSLAGRTSNNKIVNFEGPESLLGQIVLIRITDFGANSLKGVRIQSGPEGS